MIVVDDRVNSVLAAVLSASIAPIYGALAQEETSTGQRAVVSRPVKAESSSSQEATKPEDGEAADQ